MALGRDFVCCGTAVEIVMLLEGLFLTFIVCMFVRASVRACVRVYVCLLLFILSVVVFSVFKHLNNLYVHTISLQVNMN